MNKPRLNIRLGALDTGWTRVGHGLDTVESWPDRFFTRGLFVYLMMEAVRTCLLQQDYTEGCSKSVAVS